MKICFSWPFLQPPQHYYSQIPLWIKRMIGLNFQALKSLKSWGKLRNCIYMLTNMLHLCNGMLYFQKKCCPNAPLFNISLTENKMFSTHYKTPNGILFNFLLDVSNTFWLEYLSRDKAMIHLFPQHCEGKVVEAVKPCLWIKWSQTHYLQLQYSHDCIQIVVPILEMQPWKGCPRRCNPGSCTGRQWLWRVPFINCSSFTSKLIGLFWIHSIPWKPLWGFHPSDSRRSFSFPV